MAAATKITPAVAYRIIGAVSVGASIRLACHVVGIHRSSLYDYRRKNPEIDAAIREARALTDAKVVKKLFDCAMAGEGWAIKFWLTNRSKGKWTERPEVAITDQRDVTIKIVREDRIKGIDVFGVDGENADADEGRSLGELSGIAAR